MSQAVVTGLNGLSYAFILFLLAAGFSLTFGVMGVLNLAHGALYMLGAYIGLQIVSTLHAFWLGIVVAAAALAVLGFLLYWSFLKRLYNRVPEQGVLTIGVSLVLANVVLWIWGPRAKIMQTPEIFALPSSSVVTSLVAALDSDAGNVSWRCAWPDSSTSLKVKTSGSASGLTSLP